MPVPSAGPDAPYTVVQVFYGTDRNSLVAPAGMRSLPLGWSTATVFVAALTLLLGLGSLRFRRNPALRWSALGSLACTVLFVGVAGAVRFQSAPSRDLEAGEPAAAPGIVYGNQRGVLEYGTCKVTIPKTHEVGQLEAPSIFRLDFRETPERHIVLAGIEPLESQVFFDALKTRIDESSAKSAFVFVHGFNVTFEDAARRTAQIAYDLKFDGVPIFYSWPSQGGLFKYTVDETNVMWTVPHLRQFLTEVAERTEARRIHLVAHSMGNRALTSALRDLSFLPEDTRPRFSEVVLTAPDIDAEVFRKDIAPYIVQTADRVTLYASSNDTALAYSKTVHGYPRAGDSGHELLVLPGMETVDVSEVDTSLLGHSYYGSNETVLADLIEVLHKSMPPRERQWLRSAQAGPLEYWVFHR
ncbi:MAG: alpha/beta fold hydrolase [Patescibacteria group bacterium]|nr:alpha/beta fold hydrolase [Patescibacteria group bacterium]